MTRKKISSVKSIRHLKLSYFDTVSHIIQQRVVDGFANVTHWPLHVAGGDDLVSAGGVLVGGQDADLSTCHLLLVDVHRLQEDRSPLELVTITDQYPSLGLGCVGGGPSAHWAS